MMARPARSQGQDGAQIRMDPEPQASAVKYIHGKGSFSATNFDFAKLKQWRRIATRYDKLAANFLGFVKLASIMLWLK